MHINSRIRSKIFCHTMEVWTKWRPPPFAVAHQTDWKHIVPTTSFPPPPPGFKIPTYPMLLVFIRFVNVREANFCQRSSRTQICRDCSVTPSKAVLQTSPWCRKMLFARFLLCFFHNSSKLHLNPKYDSIIDFMIFVIHFKFSLPDVVPVGVLAVLQLTFCVKNLEC